MQNQEVGYKLENIDEKSIKEMFNYYNVKEDGYFYGSIMPKTSSYFLAGHGASFNVVNVYIAYDNINIYLFKLSFISNKHVVEHEIIPINTIDRVKVSSFLGIARRIKIKFKDNNTYLIQANKKVKFIENQKGSLINFINIINSK